MKAGSPMGEVDQHRHEHKFPTEAEHRAAHRRERRAAVRQAGKRAARGLVRSEWLDRNPIFGHYSPVKRGGAKFGPAPLGVGLPGTQTAPLMQTQKVARYLKQNGTDRLTSAQRRRAGLKLVSA